MKFKIYSNNLWNWLLRLGKWLIELKYLYLLFFVPTIVYIGSIYSFHNTIYAGVALQILGILLAIKGLFDIRKHFNKEGLITLAKGWLDRFPKLNAKQNIITGSSHIKIEPFSATAYGTTSSKGQTLEQRLEKIESEIDSQFIKLGQLEYKLDEYKKQNDKVIETERNDRAKEENNIKKLVEDSSINGLWLEMIGLIWIAIGILISTNSSTYFSENIQRIQESIKLSSQYSLVTTWDWFINLLSNIDPTISIAVIAACALVVSVWQSINIQKHNKLSVRPHLCTWRNNYTGQFCFTIINNGIGPAIIESFDIFVDGKKIEGDDFYTIQQAVDILFNEYPHDSKQEFLGAGYVMAAKENSDIVDLNFTTLHAPSPEEVSEIIKRARIIIKYKSAYGQNFILDTDK